MSFARTRMEAAIFRTSEDKTTKVSGEAFGNYAERF